MVSDAATAERWIGDVLEFSVARMEGPILFSFLSDFSQESFLKVRKANELLLASRETAELRAETELAAAGPGPSAARLAAYLLLALIAAAAIVGLLYRLTF